MRGNKNVVGRNADHHVIVGRQLRSQDGNLLAVVVGRPP